MADAPESKTPPATPTATSAASATTTATTSVAAAALPPPPPAPSISRRASEESASDRNQDPYSPVASSVRKQRDVDPAEPNAHAQDPFGSSRAAGSSAHEPSAGSVVGSLADSAAGSAAGSDYANYSDCGLPSEQRNVYSFGQNSYGELGHRDRHELHVPTRIEQCVGMNVVHVAAGNEHSAVLCENGDVFTCGYNDSGQCGLGNTNRTSTFQRVQALVGKGVSRIVSSNGCEHVSFLTEDGEVYTCGYNARGQLGHGTTTHATLPQPVHGLFKKRVFMVASSYYHTVVATDSDEVYAFGRNDYGQLGVGDSKDSPSPRCVDR